MPEAVGNRIELPALNAQGGGVDFATVDRVSMHGGGDDFSYIRRGMYATFNKP